MIVRQLSALAALLAAMSGCAILRPPEPKALEHPTRAPVAAATPAPAHPTLVPDSTEYAAYLRGGDAEIRAQAFLRTRGGDVKLAAGMTAYLDPLTGYAREWWTQRGRSLQWFGVAPPDPIFKRARRETIVDAQGNFRFAGLAPGWYVVHTRVTWEVNYQLQGGVVGDTVLARMGDHGVVILTER